MFKKVFVAIFVGMFLMVGLSSPSVAQNDISRPIVGISPEVKWIKAQQYPACFPRDCMKPFLPRKEPGVYAKIANLHAGDRIQFQKKTKKGWKVVKKIVHKNRNKFSRVVSLKRPVPGYYRVKISRYFNVIPMEGRKRPIPIKTDHVFSKKVLIFAWR